MNLEVRDKSVGDAAKIRRKRFSENILRITRLLRVTWRDKRLYPKEKRELVHRDGEYTRGNQTVAYSFLAVTPAIEPPPSPPLFWFETAGNLIKTSTLLIDGYCIARSVD